MVPAPAKFEERGYKVSENVEFKVLEDTENLRHIVIPYLGMDVPATAEELEQRATKYWIIV